MAIDLLILTFLVITIILIFVTLLKINKKQKNSHELDLNQINQNLENLFNKTLEQSGYVNSKIDEIGHLTKMLQYFFYEGILRKLYILYLYQNNNHLFQIRYSV